MNTPCELLSSLVQPVETAPAKDEEKPSIEDKNESFTSKSQGKVKKNSVTASMSESNTGPWTEEEHSKFLEAMSRYGNNWNKVCQFIGMRTPNQVRSHAQKYYNRQRKLAIQKARADKSGKKKIFAVIREFINRTAVKSALELMDVPSRAPKQKRKTPEDNFEKITKKNTKEKDEKEESKQMEKARPTENEIVPSQEQMKKSVIAVPLPQVPIYYHPVYGPCGPYGSLYTTSYPFSGLIGGINGASTNGLPYPMIFKDNNNGQPPQY